MSDYTVRAISADGDVRGFAALTKDLVQELQRRHQTLPVASAALGRTATMGALMGSMLKEEKHQVTIIVEGDGPLGRMMVDANGKGEVRGYVDNPAVFLPLNSAGKLDVASAVGKGSIYILKDLGLKEPYRGTAPIISGELAEDFTYYFTASEQIPSSVGLGVLVNRDQILTAGGYLIQVMPGAKEETISRLEKKISSLASITDFFQNGGSPEDLLIHLMGEDVQVLNRHPVTFKCRCSRERTEAMLKSLGSDELNSILKEQNQAEVTCHFCNENYLFDRTEIEKMIAELGHS